jgi:hypothetical protein
MYQISDKQIDGILSDIRARGVEMESLQQNLLDHVCCIIEQNLEENGDFETFYQRTIRTFYKEALWEIEEETISLLIFKNYYAMKKIMSISGSFSAVTMILGIIFKFQHWPGASMFVVLGIISASLIFLPLFFTLKAKEKQSVKDKAVISIGAVAASLQCLSILFKVMHWPYANIMGISALVIMLVVFLPVYFFGGIRNPETKVNTLASSVLIILGCGLVLTLIRSPKSSRMIDVRDTASFVSNEQIIKTELRLAPERLKKDSLRASPFLPGWKIIELCEELKAFIVQQETGRTSIGPDFESQNTFLREQTGINPFDNTWAQGKVTTLVNMVEEYNIGIHQIEDGLKPIPVKGFCIEYLKKGETNMLSILSLLNQLSQIQMYVLQNERQLIAAK